MDVPDAETPAPETSVGLCLSGGGFRAMLYHLGVLRRLNEAGWLPTLKQIASVSGGSIVTGVLGNAWDDLEFDNRGVAGRFAELVEQPILDLAGNTVDVPSVLFGLWPGRISTRVQKAYEKHLFHGATLQDLPDPDSAPEFRLLATDLKTGTLFQMTRQMAGSYRSPADENPTLSLAQAVAASSAFPPVLSPCVIALSSGARVFLTDGGVYDNLGVEAITKACSTVLVSDGGGTFSEPDKPKTGFLFGTIRVLSVVDVQVRRLRRRDIIADYRSGRRTGAFWAINTHPANYTQTNSALPCPPARALALSRVPTRLSKLDLTTRHQLANWGYASAEHSLRSNGLPHIGESSGFPFPGGLG
jgi:NTE family protein